MIASRHADDKGLLDLVSAFKSIGVPVSLLPRPLDLLEAPAATPEPGRRRAADRGRGARRPRLDPLQGPGPPQQPHHQGQRRRPGDERGAEHRPCPRRAARRPPRGDPRRRQLHTTTRSRPPAAPTPTSESLTQSGRGKGDAFRTGFAAVTGNLVVMLDADGSADPAEIPRFVEALEAGADFAKGSRFLPGGGSADITRARSLGNAVLSGTANLLHGTHFTDLCYGYNAFWARCLPFIAIDVPGFEVETLINLRIAGAGMKITEVPSYEKDRISGSEQPEDIPRRLPRARDDLQRGAPPPCDRQPALPVRPFESRHARDGNDLSHADGRVRDVGRRLDLQRGALGRPRRMRALARSAEPPPARDNRGGRPQPGPARAGDRGIPRGRRRVESAVPRTRRGTQHGHRPRPRGHRRLHRRRRSGRAGLARPPRGMLRRGLCRRRRGGPASTLGGLGGALDPARVLLGLRLQLHRPAGAAGSGAKPDRGEHGRAQIRAARGRRLSRGRERGRAA